MIKSIASRALPIAYSVIDEMKNAPIPGSDVNERSGGNFVLQIIGEQTPILSCRVMIPGVNIPPIEEFERWFKNSHEKASRLSEKSMLSKEDIDMPEQISAWQSRVFGRKMYGGGVVGILRNSNIAIAITFSGFSEHDDEYKCTETGFRLGIVSYDRAIEIFRISDNPWIEKFQRRH